jgi:opacity protein-like surface antigen
MLRGHGKTILAPRADARRYCCPSPSGTGATGRLGYSFVHRWLFYVKGGAAWTDEKVDDAFTNFRGIAVDPTTSNTRTGWTIGTGTEGLLHETGRQRSSMITMTSAAGDLR